MPQCDQKAPPLANSRGRTSRVVRRPPRIDLVHLPARRRPVILGHDGEVLAYAQALNLVESDRVDRVAVLDNEASLPRNCLFRSRQARGSCANGLAKSTFLCKGPYQPESDDRGSTVWGQAGAESYRNETAREIGSSTHFELTPPGQVGNAAGVTTARTPAWRRTYSA